MAGADEDISFFKQVLKDLTDHHHSSVRNTKLLDHKAGILFYWSESTKCIYTTIFTGTKSDNVQMLENESEFFQTLVCSTSPVFDVTSIKVSCTGQDLLLHGSHGIAVVELPRRWGEHGLYEGGKDVLHCRLTLLDDSYFSHHVSTEVLQVAWYPGSPNGSHVVVLTNENCFRFYDIASPNQPILRFPLFDGFHHTTGTAIFSMAGVLGDVAVDFDISEPSYDDRVNATYKLYVMQESGDVWAVSCKFAQNRLQISQQGPLIMNPPSLDNYGCSYCSLICLPSTPPTIVIATQSGCVYHCLLMDGEAGNDEDDDTADITVFESHKIEELFVYESVELELNFLQSGRDDIQQEDETRHSKIDLISSGHSDRYLAVSKGGLHSIFLPWVNDMDNLLLTDDQYPSEVKSSAEISYVVCTQPFDKSPAGSICGCTIVTSERKVPSIVCLMMSGEFLHLHINRSAGLIESNHHENEPSLTTGLYTSPIRRLHSAGNFDAHIRQILSKDTVVPRIRSGGGEETVPIDVYYKLLTKTTQILREEYLKKLLEAKVELENRCKLLSAKKEQQIKEINKLQNDEELSRNGEELASKLEVVQENTVSLGKRVGAVFRMMLASSPVISNEEKAWERELKSLYEKLHKQKRCIESVKIKHENIILQTIPNISNSRNIKPHGQSSLSATQNIKVRAVLKDQGSVISKLVDDVQALNVHMGS